MSPLLWLQRLLGPKTDDETVSGELMDLDNDEPFIFNQHMRIILALITVIISGFVMWWIVA